MFCDASEDIDQGGSAKAEAAADVPPIDREALLTRCMGNAALADSLLSHFLSHGKHQVEVLGRLATSDQPAAAGESAHALKGTAAVIGAGSLSAKAAEIEDAGRDGEIRRVRNLISELGIEMDRCLAYIPTLLSAAE